jgi:hypothetical protein
MRIFALIALFAVVAGLAPAQPTDYVPGSVLIYPTVDSRAGMGKGTVISVTNTNASRVVSPINNYRNGDVQVHYYYVEGLEPYNNVFNRKEMLTPNDTLTVLAGTHNPEMEVGYLIVVAEDPESEAAIEFDYLIGDEIVVDVKQNKLWSIPAIAFQALPQGPVGTPLDNNGRRLTDVNRNGSVDFDGIEYDMYPDVLFISSFFEQGATIESELILVSGLGSYYRVDVDFLFYDNEEDVFSRDYAFTCWTTEKLADISNVTKSLGGSATEAATGWARIDGDYAIHVLTGALWTNEVCEGPYDPPILGAFVQRIVGSTGFEFGHLLHHEGAQNGNEFPWCFDGKCEK